MAILKFQTAEILQTSFKLAIYNKIISSNSDLLEIIILIPKKLGTLTE